jgi:hypothetical protein
MDSIDTRQRRVESGAADLRPCGSSGEGFDRPAEAGAQRHDHKT